MPIRPEQAAQLTDAERTKLREAENHVDAELRKRFEGPGSSVRIKLPEGLTQRACEELFKRYRAAGWLVYHGSSVEKGLHIGQPKPMPGCSSLADQISAVESNPNWGPYS